MIAIDRLTRTFGALTVLDGLSLAIEPGERVALFGPNGSGKTTLLRCVLGTVTPTAGTVTVGGHRAGTFAARSLIGVSLAQERSFYLRLSGRENLILFARLRGLSRRAAASRVGELVKELELVEVAGKRADRCSTGQLQQLGFARALLGEPPVLLLDEPTRSLDHDARERTWAALDRRRDRAVVLASHLDADIELCDRVIPLRATSTDGRGGGVIRYAVAAALARRDFEINRSYRTAFVLDLFWGAIDILFYYFFSKVVGVSPDADLGGAPSYFAFALAGVMVSVVILSATSTISSRVREEQLTGTLEFICANPVRSSEFALGTAAFPFLYATVRVTVYLVIAVAFLGLAAGEVNWAGVLVIMPLSGLAMLGIGVLAAAATIVFKRGGSVVTVAVFGMTFISGALFPVSLLPAWLQPISRLMPTTSALNGLRQALYGGGGVWSEALILAGWAVLLLPLSLWLFGHAVDRARAQGALAQY